MSSFREPLDIFGQNPRLSKLYTQLCFCFPLPDQTENVENIKSHLQRCLDVLTSSFPWVAGQVVQTDGGVFTIVPFENIPQFRVHDKSTELPTFEEYRNEGFPFKWLNEKDIASHSTLPDGRGDPAPVLALQATFVSGGVFLTFSAQHNCMDMAGQCQVIQLFSEACHGAAEFTNEELRTGNLSREQIISLLIDPPKDRESSTAKASSNILSQAERPKAETQAIWTYFLFSATALSTIKSLAQKNIHTEFISTDDAICAFLWKHVIKARVSRLRHAMSSTKSTFERQVDVRKHLGLPETYTGNAVHKTSTMLSVEEVVSRPLGHLASELRLSLSPTPDLGYRARESATKLHRELQTSKPGKGSDTRGKVSSMDIKMSSWAKEDCYNFDFGGALGTPEAVRRPNFEGWEGLAYLIPKSREGDIAAAVCLSEEDLRGLRREEEFIRFGQFVG